MKWNDNQRVIVHRCLVDKPQISGVPSYGYILQDAAFNPNLREDAPPMVEARVCRPGIHADKAVVFISYIDADKQLGAVWAHVDDIEAAP